MWFYRFFFVALLIQVAFTFMRIKPKPGTKVIPYNADEETLKTTGDKYDSALKECETFLDCFSPPCHWSTCDPKTKKCNCII